MNKNKGKTPKEIMQSLECCVRDCRPMEKCAYKAHADCISTLQTDVLDYMRILVSTFQKLEHSLHERGFEDINALFADYDRLAKDRDTKGDWMSMEQPPKETGNYIVYTSNEAVCTARYYAKDGRFSGTAGKHVTHWMPRPEPPKEK